MNARYYNGVKGKFLSQDPLFWDLPKEYLSDPQQQNSYSYARNNPINGTDHSGMFFERVPGTDLLSWLPKFMHTSNYDNWVNSPNGKQMETNMLNTFDPDHKYGSSTLNWPGQDNDNARQNAAKDLFNTISNHTFESGEPLNVVCHSHGCNVVALYSQMEGARKIDNLVTEGVPVLGDYSLNQNNVGKHVNVYSNFDGVQLFGGNQLTLSQIVGGVVGCSVGPAGCIAGKAIGKYFSKGEFGSAGRIVPGADQNSDATRDTNKNRYSNHSELYKNRAIWAKYVKNYIK